MTSWPASLPTDSAYRFQAAQELYRRRDRTLGVQGRDLTPAAVQLTALAGVLTSFGEAQAKVLPKMAGLRLAESTVQRVTEAAGQRVQQEQAQGRTYGPATPWN